MCTAVVKAVVEYRDGKCTDKCINEYNYIIYMYDKYSSTTCIFVWCRIKYLDLEGTQFILFINKYLMYRERLN